MIDLSKQYPVGLEPGINDFFKQTEFNRYEVRIIRQQLTRECLGRFKWESNNVPIANIEHIEEYLLTFGALSLFRYNVTGELFITPFTMYGNYNIYSYPPAIRPYNPYGGNILNIDKLDEGEFAICYENNMRVSTVPEIKYYANRLADITKAFSSRLNASKIASAMVSESIDSDLSMKNVKEQIEAGYGFLVFRDEKTFENATHVYDLKVDVQAKEYIIAYEKYHNYFRESIGINCNPSPKSERMITSEANSNNDSIRYNLEQYLMERQRFCIYANKLFDCGISVSVTGGVNNGILYNNAGGNL